MVALTSAFVAVAVAVVVSSQTASAAPASSGDDASVTSVNRRLATLVVTPLSQKPAIPNAAAASQPVPEFAPPPAQRWMLSPSLLSVASRFTKVERLMHVRTNALDANFWGVFGGRPGVKLHYVIRF